MALAFPQFSLGLGIDYARGDFGTDSTSTYTTIPLTFNWYPGERFNMELVVPFLDQNTSTTGYAATGGNVSAAHVHNDGGRGVSMSAVNMSGMDMSGTDMSGMNMSGMSTVVAGSEDQSGLGDITMSAVYNVMVDRDASPQIGLSCYLKFPTADDEKGLGTGSFDWGPGLQFSKWLGDWQPFVEGRYIFQGASRAETGARDYFLADAGLGYAWSENLYTSMYSRFGSATFDGMAAPLELRLKTVWGFGENTATEFYLMKGFNDGSPEYGGGIAFFVDF